MKRPRRWRSYSAALTFLGGLSLTVGVIPSDRLPSFVRHLEPFATHLVAAGLVLLSVAAIVFVGGWCRDTVQPRRFQFTCQRARRTELKALFTFCSRYLGGDIAPLRQMKDWHSKNDHIFFVVRRSHSWFWQRAWSQPQMIGYFAIIPLTDTAAAEVGAERLVGTEFKTSDVTSAMQLSQCFYIGGVAARRSRLQVVRYLRSEVIAALEQGPSTIYARPVTQAGLRLAANHGLKPVAPGIGHEIDRVHSICLERLPQAGHSDRRKEVRRRIANLSRRKD